jgi:hypothetical protein
LNVKPILDVARWKSFGPWILLGSFSSVKPSAESASWK